MSWLLAILKFQNIFLNISRLLEISICSWLSLRVYGSKTAGDLIVFLLQFILKFVLHLHECKYSCFSQRGCDDTELDFASLCKLGFACRSLHMQFHLTRKVYVYVVQNTKKITLPRHMRWVVACVPKLCRLKSFKWWMDKILSDHDPIQCTLQCGSVTKLRWIAFTSYFYQFVQKRGELRGALHIAVTCFRLHKQGKWRCPSEFLWVADRAHLLFHISSHITIGTPNIDINSRWVLERLGLSETAAERNP